MCVNKRYLYHPHSIKTSPCSFSVCVCVCLWEEEINYQAKINRTITIQPGLANIVQDQDSPPKTALVKVVTVQILASAVTWKVKTANCHSASSPAELTKY